MNTEHVVLVGIAAILLATVGFQAYSMLVPPQTAAAPAAPMAAAAPAASGVKLPANIQSAAPMHFKSAEEEIAYYRKNAKNPNNVDIEKAVRNMDANLDGICDSCGMAILHCIESGMEDM